jgi:protein dithiol oxidoreductase (disulfide-forming)
MQRRDFSRALAVSAGLTALTGFPLAQAQTPAALREGRDFVSLPKPAPVDAPAGQIEVLEFFAYTCIHCYNFEPLFEDWKKGVRSDVVVRRVPVAFSEAFVPLQRLYYALEGMQQLDALHMKVFKAIHDEKLRLTTPDAILAWVGKQGLDTKNSPGSTTRSRWTARCGERCSCRMPTRSRAPRRWASQGAFMSLVRDHAPWRWPMP